MQGWLRRGFALAPEAVRLQGMSDSPSTSGSAPGTPATAAPHPVDAVLAALRAVPDSELRDVLPLQVFAPALDAPGGVGAGPVGAAPAAGSAVAGSTR
jgi:hypothetical protein